MPIECLEYVYIQTYRYILCYSGAWRPAPTQEAFVTHDNEASLCAYYAIILIMSNGLNKKVIDNIEVIPTIPQTNQYDKQNQNQNQKTNSQKQREKDGKITENNESKIRY